MLVLDQEQDNSVNCFIFIGCSWYNCPPGSYFGSKVTTIKQEPCLRWDSVQGPETDRYRKMLTLQERSSSKCRVVTETSSAPWCLIRKPTEMTTNFSSIINIAETGTSWRHCFPPCYRPMQSRDLLTWRSTALFGSLDRFLQCTHSSPECESSCFQNFFSIYNKCLNNQQYLSPASVPSLTLPKKILGVNVLNVNGGGVGTQASREHSPSTSRPIKKNLVPAIFSKVQCLKREAIQHNECYGCVTSFSKCTNSCAALTGAQCLTCLSKAMLADGNQLNQCLSCSKKLKDMYYNC